MASDSLDQHLNEAPYLKGVVNGHWRMHSRDGSVVIFEVATPLGSWIALRLDVSEYPQSAPLGQFWDLARGTRLADAAWPKVDGQAFRTDMAGLYIACDRTGLSAHSNWAQESPNTCWRSDIGVARYLAVVYNLLQRAKFESPAA